MRIGSEIACTTSVPALPAPALLGRGIGGWFVGWVRAVWAGGKGFGAGFARVRATSGVLRVGQVEFFGRGRVGFVRFAFAVGDEEQVFGAGEADVEQAALFFVFLLVDGGVCGFGEADADGVAVAVAPGRHGVGAAAFVVAAGGEDDDGRFEAFGFVDGEQVDGVLSRQRRGFSPVGIRRGGELGAPPGAKLCRALFGRVFGEDGLDVAQVEEVAQVVRRGAGGEGLPDVVFFVGEQRVEGGEQSPALPGIVRLGERFAQFGQGEFVRARGDFALFDGGEAVEVLLAVAVVEAA